MIYDPSFNKKDFILHQISFTVFITNTFQIQIMFYTYSGKYNGKGMGSCSNMGFDHSAQQKTPAHAAYPD